MAILLLSISSPRRGTPLYFTGTGSVRGDGSSSRLRLEEKPDCGFGFDDFPHVLEFSNFDICCIRVIY